MPPIPNQKEQNLIAKIEECEGSLQTVDSIIANGDYITYWNDFIAECEEYAGYFITNISSYRYRIGFKHTSTTATFTAYDKVTNLPKQMLVYTIISSGLINIAIITPYRSSEYIIDYGKQLYTSNSNQLINGLLVDIEYFLLYRNGGFVYNTEEVT